MPSVGDLVQAGTGIPRPPTRCPNGHQLGPNKALVGHQACLSHGGGHTTWTCRTCDQTVYGPPLNTHCSALEGPAAVRISTSAPCLGACTAAFEIRTTAGRWRLAVSTFETAGNVGPRPQLFGVVRCLSSPDTSHRC